MDVNSESDVVEVWLDLQIGTVYGQPNYMPVLNISPGMPLCDFKSLERSAPPEVWRTRIAGWLEEVHLNPTLPWVQIDVNMNKKNRKKLAKLYKMLWDFWKSTPYFKPEFQHQTRTMKWPPCIVLETFSYEAAAAWGVAETARLLQKWRDKCSHVSGKTVELAFVHRYKVLPTDHSKQ